MIIVYVAIKPRGASVHQQMLIAVQYYSSLHTDQRLSYCVVRDKNSYRVRPQPVYSYSSSYTEVIEFRPL